MRSAPTSAALEAHCRSASCLEWAYATGVRPDRAEEALGSRGEALYGARCASCHEGGVARAPDINALRQFRPERMSFALMFGMMSQQGRDLSQGEIRDIVRYLVGAPPEQQQPCRILCAVSRPRACGRFVATLERLGRRHRSTPVSTRCHGPAFAGRCSAPETEMGVRLSWRYQGLCAADGLGWPSFVGSAGGKVYALDAKRGCQRWVFDAGFGVRTAITIGEDERGTTAYFGDQRGEAYALNAESGKLLWKRRVDAHAGAVITGAPTLANNVLYVPVSSFEEVLAIDPRYSCCPFRV